MWHTSRTKMVDFQPGWDSLNWCQDVKLKMSFFSEIPKYLRKENTWRFYLFWGLLICKSRANLIFQVLPDYIWFLWTFALKFQIECHSRKSCRKTHFCPSLWELRDSLVWSWNVGFVVFLVENRKWAYTVRIKSFLCVTQIFDRGNYMMIIISVKKTFRLLCFFSAGNLIVKLYVHSFQ